MSSRRGIALPVAVMALVIISLFVAGTAFVASQEFRAGRNALTERATLESAELGLGVVLRDWDPAWNLTLPVGASPAPFVLAPVQGGSVTVRVTRVSGTTFWAVSEAASGVNGARTSSRRTVGAFLRLALAAPDVPAALTVRDSAEVRAGGMVSGADSSVAGPASIAACRAVSGVAGVAASDTTRVCDGSCGAASGYIVGTPPRFEDPHALDSLRYVLFGDRSWQSLASAADIVLSPGVVVTPGPTAIGAACARTVSTNWGDPGGASACRDYFPIIWARGDVTISGGAGQGILLADGDIKLAAGARFVGLVVSKDDIVTLSGGGEILGAALAADFRGGAGDHTVIGPGGYIGYSACGLQMALLGTARLARVTQRSWAEFY